MVAAVRFECSGCERFRQLGSIEDSERRSVRAMAGNAPRHAWHSQQRRSFGICKLQNLKEAGKFESHSLRQTFLYESL